MKREITKTVTLSKDAFMFLLTEVNEKIEMAKHNIEQINNEKKLEEKAKADGREYKIFDFYFQYAEEAEDDLKNYVPIREMLLGIYDFESEV